MGRLPLPVFLLVDELVSDEVEVSDALDDAFSAVAEDDFDSLLVALFASFAIANCLLWTRILALNYSRQSFKKRGWFNILSTIPDMFSKDLVRAGRLELPLPKKTDFESAASTGSATPARGPLIMMAVDTG
jgi:hypothetical protein